MEDLENQNPRGGQGTASERETLADETVQALAARLQRLHRNLLDPLVEDVARLQAEKAQLLAAIDQLKAEQTALQTRNGQMLSQAQLSQQQLWARQLSQVLAAHLQKHLTQRLPEIVNASLPQAEVADPSSALSPQLRRQADELLLALDSSLRSTLTTLQRDLGSYESALSQQLSRMHVQEQQGEVILAALVSRLREQFRDTSGGGTPPPAPPSFSPDLPSMEATVRPEPVNEPPPPAASNYAPPPPRAVERSSPPQEAMRSEGRSVAMTVRPASPALVHVPTPPSARPPDQPNWLLGLVLVLLSSSLLSLHNVLVRITLSPPQTVLGRFVLGGNLEPTFAHALLILFLRLLFITPVLWLLANQLRPLGPDLRKLLAKGNGSLRLRVLGSAVFLFLSQLFLYIALGSLKAGTATTSFFIYPTVAALLAWFLFRDRPIWLRWLPILAVYAGTFLTLNATGSDAPDLAGVAAALTAGVTFAVSLLLTDACVPSIHPLPLTVVNFGLLLLFSAMGLLLPGANVWALLGSGLDQTVLYLCLAMAVTTLGSYLIYHFGIRLIGPAPASVAAASDPAFTVLLASWLIQETLTPGQYLGVILVTVGVAALFALDRPLRSRAVRPGPARRPLARR